MIYDENGTSLIGDFEFTKAFKESLQSINEITESFNDLRIVLEKETIARQIDSCSNSKNISASDDKYIFQPKVSVLNNDVMSARQHGLNKFDEERTKLILESENICKEYEKWASFDLEHAKWSGDNQNNTGVEYNMAETYHALRAIGMSDSEIKKYILQEFYNVSDDPEVIKKMLRLRLNYNKKMISLYKKMIELNYKVLNLTKEEADNLTKQPDTNTIRDIILANKTKFIKRNGTFYDLRELGFGVAFIQEGTTGLENFTTLDHFLNLLVRYDVVFITHGKYNTFTLRNLVSRSWWKEIKFFFEYTYKMSMITAKYGRNCTIENFSEDDRAEFNRLKSSMCEKYNMNKNNPDLGPVGVGSKWLCMPISTEFGGPYTNVVKLITQCIKEARLSKQKYNMIGSKNNIHIMVLCCNPGSIPLPKSITSQKDVHIHYGKTSVLAENAVSDIYNYSIDDTCNTIKSCEKALIEFCNDVGIDYNDDKYLQECYNTVDENIDLLMEITAKELWSSVVTLAKKIWGAIVAAFKFVWNLIKDIVHKIKSLITDRNAEVQDAIFIAVESARVKQCKNQSIGNIQYNIEKSCNTIAGKIKQLETTQTNIMKKIDQDLAKRASQAN